MTAHHPNKRTTRALIALLLIASPIAIQPAGADAETKQSLPPLPSLNNVEECQRADLSRSYGKTFRFHHGACWADVDIDENGKITSFIPEDEEACKRALRENCGWLD